MISRIKTVTVYVADQEAAKEFYTETLGFEVQVEEPMGSDATWLQVAPPDAETHVLLYPRDEHDDWESRRAGLVLYAEDVQATCEELEADGVTVTTPPEEQPYGTWAEFEDPDGNTFGLVDTP